MRVSGEPHRVPCQLLRGLSMTTHLDPRHTDAEMLRACAGLRSDTVRQLAERLKRRGEIAQDVRQRMESIQPLLAAGSLAEALATIDRCRADLDWCFAAPDYPANPEQSEN